MLGFKSLWTTLSDWKAAGLTLSQSIRLYPRLVLWNSPLVIIVLTLSYVYFNFILDFNQLQMPPSLKELYIVMIQFCFMVIVWSFVIFLIPYQLYNYFMKKKNSKFKKTKFKNFLNTHLWPVIIDTLKGFFVALGYFIAAILIWLALFYSSVLLFSGLKEQVQQFSVSFMSLLVNSPEGVSMKDFLAIVLTFKKVGLWIILFLVSLIPSAIKALQYIIIPFVTIFNKQARTKSCLKISEKLSDGLLLPFLCLFLLFALFSFFLPLNKWLVSWLGESNWVIYIQILLGSLKYIFYTSFFCIIYFKKDKKVLQ